MKNKILGALLLIAFICPIQGNCKATADAQHSEQYNAPPQPIVVNVVSPERTKQEASDQKAKDDHNSRIKTRELILTLVIALAAVVQAGVSIFQWRVYKLQTRAMFSTLRQNAKSATAAIRSVEALEKLERPFLMVELRDKNEVWVINKGKVPAQIIWYNPQGSLIFKTQEQIEALPPNFDYGYLCDVETAEVINVPWIAPGGEMHLTTFAWISPSEELIRAYREGQQFALLLSTVKYRGMLTENVYESRWCFRWFGKDYGLKLAGPFGYNSYT